MVSFFLAVLCLAAGYFVYGKIIDRNFGPDGRDTPAIAVNDGVDFVPMPTWKVFMIQVLNIAGNGPILGALSGALFGPIVYLWIVFGCIFAGAVHDYSIGMLSVRNRGASVSEITGKYLGNGMKQVMRVFSVVLLVMIGVIFSKGPAGLLALLTPDKLDESFWFWIVIIYYFIATFVPIDKVIGKLYPLFGACLVFMALGVGGSLAFSGRFEMPELWNHFSNQHAQGTPVWPFMFITVACGAISGFHSTQSPMMARCIKDERKGRAVFYGAMIVEGVIALVWAAAGVSCYESSRALLDAGAGCSAVVYEICQTTMGKIGAIIALLGVIVCPISSGDTAFRAARLTLADWFGMEQGTVKHRLILTVPLLAAAVVICQLDYSTVWRYNAWANQTLAMIVLWAASVYMRQEKKNYRFTLVPAIFMTAVSATYLITAPECFGALWSTLGIAFDSYYPVGAGVGILTAVLLTVIFERSGMKDRKLS